MAKLRVIKPGDNPHTLSVKSLPSGYTLEVHRRAVNIDSVNSSWDEEFTWSVDDEVLDHEIGLTMLFSHLLSIIDILQAESPHAREELKSYFMSDLLKEVEDDRNFNR